jgi:hypothetical protein
MYDSDTWYFSLYWSAARNADTANAVLQKTAYYGSGDLIGRTGQPVTDDLGAEVMPQEATGDLLGAHELFLADSFGSGMYAYDTETGVISSVAEDGTKTPLNTAEYRKWQETGAAQEYRTNLSELAKLTDTKYFVEGYHLTREGNSAQSFWQIFDTAAGTAVGGDQDMIGYDSIFSDGNAGIYAVMWNDAAERYAVAHITEEKVEFVLDEYARSCGWYVYGNCIYYRIPEDDSQTDRVPDFYCYNMETKETAVVLENCGFDITVFTGDRVYAQIGADEDEHTVHIASFNPDLTDRKDITFSIAEFTQNTVGYTYLKDFCGDCLIFEAPVRIDGAQLSDEPSEYGIAVAADPGFLLYHLSDGTVQCVRPE